MTVATDVALGAMVLLVWLGTAAFLRLPSPLERLHCAAFVYVAAGTALLAAAALADGLTIRVAKIAVLLVCSLVGGAASAHAVGRALVLRGSVTEAELVSKLEAGERR